MSNLFGAHINSELTNITLETQKLQRFHCNLVQLFVQPLSTKNKVYYEGFRLHLKNNKLHCVVHASYTINLAKQWDSYTPHVQAFINEIETASFIGAFGIVVHMGKQLDLSLQDAYNNMFTSLIYVHNKTKHTNVKILLETSTGQGSELCYKLEDLAYFYNKFAKHKLSGVSERFKLCLDTCHIFAAGYDLRNKKLVKAYIESFDSLIGLQYVSLIHLNDSRNDLESHVDRHENLGDGYIGSEGLKAWVSYFKKLGVPFVLETPGDYKKAVLEYLT